MHLDKASKELVVKIVYASEDVGALDEVQALAAHAKPGTATPIVSRLGDAVRTFELRMAQLQVRGFAVQLKIVGVSLDQLAGDGTGVEKTLFAADGAIFIGETASGFGRVRALFSAGPIVAVSAAPIDGIDAIATAPTARAGLQALLKPLMAELAQQLE
jgi:hypothetical protein